MANPIHKTKFRRWLRHKNKEIVGQTVSSTTCPLAMYLRDQGNGYAFVDSYCMWYGTEYEGYETEAIPNAWQVAFIERLDTIGLPESSITGAEALLILQAITDQ